MKKIIVRKGYMSASILSVILIIITMIILLDMIFKKDSSNLLAFGISGFITLMLIWIVFDSYIQIIKFREHDITINQGLLRYRHMSYENIVSIKVVEFENLPKVKKGALLRGLRDSYKMPKVISRKWIVLHDGKIQDNLSNIYSYLVPIRKHMLIKMCYDPDILDYFKENHSKINIDFITISE
jgi:hypothetical protein